MGAMTAALSSEILDDLLIRWHYWRMGYRPARGFNRASSVTGDSLTSRQYDDANGALDDALEERIMRQVEYEVEQLPALHHIAICVQARALVVGCEVFTNPRLPVDRAVREGLVRQARAGLVMRLLAAGIM